MLAQVWNQSWKHLTPQHSCRTTRATLFCAQSNICSSHQGHCHSFNTNQTSRDSHYLPIIGGSLIMGLWFMAFFSTPMSEINSGSIKRRLLLWIVCHDQIFLEFFHSSFFLIVCYSVKLSFMFTGNACLNASKLGEKFCVNAFLWSTCPIVFFNFFFEWP